MHLKDCLLGDVVTFQRGHDLPKAQMFDGPYPVLGSNGIIGYHNRYTTTGPVIVVGRSGNVGHPFMVKSNAWAHNTSLYIKDFKGNDPIFIYYFLQTLNLAKFAGGSAVPTLNRNHINTIEVKIPEDVSVQRKIGSILASFDEKISTNNRINDNLFAQARTIFANKFCNINTIPTGWKKGSLLDIATYLNGLAMQKFWPGAHEEGLPVLKIKELRQGFCDSTSEFCSQNINSEYIIDDGDVIFSWSGSLLVDLWGGGTCGLNQHLFKVTSNTHPKWFYYLWTLHHLDKFINIAADKATTMGHIKRGDLAQAEVLIPSEEDCRKIGQILSPIVKLMILNKIESRKLRMLRDNLLEELIS